MGLKNSRHFTNPGVNAWASGKTSTLDLKRELETELDRMGAFPGLESWGPWQGWSDAFRKPTQYLRILFEAVSPDSDRSNFPAKRQVYSSNSTRIAEWLESLVPAHARRANVPSRGRTTNDSTDHRRGGCRIFEVPSPPSGQGWTCVIHSWIDSPSKSTWSIRSIPAVLRPQIPPGATSSVPAADSLNISSSRAAARYRSESRTKLS